MKSDPWRLTTSESLENLFWRLNLDAPSIATGTRTFQLLLWLLRCFGDFYRRRAYDRPFHPTIERRFKRTGKPRLRVLPMQCEQGSLLHFRSFGVLASSWTQRFGWTLFTERLDRRFGGIDRARCPSNRDSPLEPAAAGAKALTNDR